MKKIVTLSSVLLGVVFLAGCSQQPVSQTQPTAPDTVAQTPTQPVVTQPAPSTPAVTQNYVEVKEFGIKIPIDSAMVGDLAYTFKKAGADVSVDVATFSSKALTAADKNCGSSSGPTIQKILGTPSKPSGGADPEYYTSRMSDIKQYSGYFLVFMNSQDSCTLGKNVGLEKKLDQAVSVGFKNAVLIAQ